MSKKDDEEIIFTFIFVMSLVIWTILVKLGVNGLLALFIGIIPAAVYDLATGVLDDN